MNRSSDPSKLPFGAQPEAATGPFRERLWRIIFLSDTPGGRG